MLIPYLNITDCIGIASLGGNVYRLDFPEYSRLATDEEILHAERDYYCDLVNQERNEREQNTFPYLGKLFNSDPVSVQRLNGAWCAAKMAQDLGADFSIGWTCADNTDMVLGVSEMLGIIPALASYVARLHVYARGLKAAIRESTEPSTIQIYTGWPE